MTDIKSNKCAVELSHTILSKLIGTNPYRVNTVLARQLASMQSGYTRKLFCPDSPLDPNPVRALLEISEILPRILKLFKYYNESAHLYYRDIDETKASPSLRNFILGIGLLRNDIMTSAYRICEYADRGSNSIVNILERIIKDHNATEPVKDLIFKYIKPFIHTLPQEIANNYDVCTDADGYRFYMYKDPVKTPLTPEDGNSPRYADNYECSYLFPPRRYLTKAEINLTSQLLTVKLNPYQATKTQQELRRLQDLLRNDKFISAVKELSEIFKDIVPDDIAVKAIDELVNFGFSGKNLLSTTISAGHVDSLDVDHIA